MKKIILLIIIVCNAALVFAQTFTNAIGGPIPDDNSYGTFPITVSGLPSSSLDKSSFGLEMVTINISHPNDGDIRIKLQSPDGTLYVLSSFNGGAGADYTNTNFTDTAANSIAMGVAPFTGYFKSTDALAGFNNGQNGNGTWSLNIRDQTPGNVGAVVSWSITFGNHPAGVINFDSNLPIVVINTNGQTIVDQPKIDAKMGIIYNGAGVRNHLSDPFNNYNNNIGIELRGSTSQMFFPQYSYGFTTQDATHANNDTMLLGMPAEHDWILYAPYDDKTCMRDVLSYDIATKMGHYASRTVYCELMLNGQYEGIYVMMEKIKRDSNRVNIAKLSSKDTVGDAVTGGYIIKIDKTTGNGGGGWNSNYLSVAGTTVPLQYSYPKDVDIAPKQAEYIQKYIDTMENVLSSANFADPVNGYRKYLGVNSFIDFFISNEISKNVDAYDISTFMYKDKQSNGGKLKAGPIWDFNIAWMNCDYAEGSLYTGWSYNEVGGAEPFWWSRLLEDPAYTSQLKCRWTELRQTTLSIPTINHFIDSIAGYLNEAQVRHFTQWPILGVYTWPNPWPYPADYAGEITALKNWIQNRFAWMDANLPGTCTVGIAESPLSESNVRVYPNPFQNSIQLNFYLPHAEKIKIELLDIVGKTIKELNEKEFQEGDNNLEINFGDSELKTGMYFLKIISSKGTTVKKITKAE